MRRLLPLIYVLLGAGLGYCAAHVPLLAVVPAAACPPCPEALSPDPLSPDPDEGDGGTVVPPDPAPEEAPQ